MSTQINGTLFKYSTRLRTNVAFSAGERPFVLGELNEVYGSITEAILSDSGRLRESKHFILIGGLTDGLLDPGCGPLPSVRSGVLCAVL